MNSEADVARFLASRPETMRILDLAAALGLPDAWVGAGFVRNAVWDHLFGGKTEAADVDVVYFEPGEVSPARDARLEAILRSRAPGFAWSVKNQARMHRRNGDARYRDTADAIARWPETCTAIAARLRGLQVEIVAPFGVADLLAGVVRPTPAFAMKPALFRERLRQKRWDERWPGVRIEER